MVEGGVGHGDKVRIADGHRQGAVFGEVEQLRGGGWDDHPQGLGQDHQLHHSGGFQSQRLGRFPLSLFDGEDARPDNFRHEGGGVQDQSRTQGNKFRREEPSPLKVEPLQLGHFPEGGEEESSLAEIDVGQGVQGLLNRWEALQYQGVAKEKLQQQGGVAEDFNVTLGQFGEQPVFGEPHQADGHPQSQCGDIAEDGHLQGVEDAHPKGLQITFVGPVFNEGFTDFKTRLQGEEAEA